LEASGINMSQWQKLVVNHDCKKCGAEFNSDWEAVRHKSSGCSGSSTSQKLEQMTCSTCYRRFYSAGEYHRHTNGCGNQARYAKLSESSSSSSSGGFKPLLGGSSSIRRTYDPYGSGAGTSGTSGFQSMPKAPQLRCSNCCKDFPDPYSLAAHSGTCRGGGRTTCSRCYREFHSRMEFENHAKNCR
jgi:hypothetical protein